MKFEIKNWMTGGLIFSIETDSWKLAVEAALKSGTNLSYANLHYADLRSANLSYANLHYANLSSADLRYADLRYADLRSANLSSANLSYANLSYANLRYADLRYADLRYADLKDAKNLRLPTGETWHEYLTETVPALLVAGGKSLQSFRESWTCHEWTNCPMAHAFDVHDLKDVPILYRSHAEQFVQFFDAGQIPITVLGPEVEAASCEKAGEEQ